MFEKIQVVGIVTLVVGFSLLIGTSMALESKPVLSLEVAEKMAMECEKFAQKAELRLNIAIVDDGGLLKYFRRMDGAFKGSIDIALNKAYSTILFGLPTKRLGELVNREPGKVHGLQFMPRLTIFEGGLPIQAKGETIGGIGVSGARGEQDAMCAQAGLDAVAEDLK